MSVRLKIRHLDLDQTLGCGQAFRWRRADPGTWSGPIGDCVATLRREGQWLHGDAVPGRPDLRRRVSAYLRTGDDIGRVHAGLSEDPVMARGLEAVQGLRIVKMDEWECLISYVLATFANIPRIAGMIERLATRYGDPIDGRTHGFPDSEHLRAASASELRSCGLGYRAEYIASICKAVDRHRLAEMRRMSDPDLRDALLGLPGVGNKVADCVSLFGFGRLTAFPIDVWVERALARLYGVRGPYDTLRDFAEERFGEYAGYAQEYLFYNERVLSGSGGCVFTRRGGSSGRTP
jgi:N-glycosylase/DNA lyase